MGSSPPDAGGGFPNIHKEIAMSRIQSLFSKRAMVAGLLFGSAALAATSFAMPGGFGGQGGPGCEARLGQQAQAQRQATRQQARQDMHAKRLAGLKDKLKLEPRQEAAWQAFANVAAVGKGPVGREDRQAMRDELGKLNTPQRLDTILARADERRAQMVKRVEAVKQFYAQLSAEQQKVFDAEARPFRDGRPGHHRHAGGPGRQS
jgi:Spy/CpxP family protein refolding chaperone